MRPLALLLSSASLVLILGSPARGQITNVSNDQSTLIPGAGHDYIRMLNETVNPANGSASLRLNVPVPKGRGLSIPFSFAYDSNGFWHLTGDGANDGGAIWISDATILSQGGWSYSAPLLSFFSSSAPWFNGGGSCSFTTSFMFQDPAGARHSLGLSTTTDGQGGDGNAACGLTPFTSGGDDFVKASTPNATNVINPQTWLANLDGTVFYFSAAKLHQWAYAAGVILPDYIEDRNGNKILVQDYMTQQGANRGSFAYTDTLGRAALSSSGFGASGTTVSVSGLTGNFTLTWGTAASSYSISSQYLNPPGNCAAPPHVSGSQGVVTAIALPNGKSYNFYYDSTYGLLNKVVYPTGGYVRYVWGINSLSDTAEYAAGCTPGQTCNPPGFCDYRYDTPVVIHRYVSFDGTNEVLRQDFSYSTNWPSSSSAYWSTKQTIVTTADLVRGASFQTTYTYAPSGCGGPDSPNTTSHIATQCPVEQTVLYQDWNGSTLRTVNKTWADVNMLLSKQVTLENGQTSKTAYSYLNNNSTPLVTEKDEYEYGQGSLGPILRKTATNYASFAATPIYPYSPSLLDRPSSVITYDGSNNRVAESDYAFDQTSVPGVSNLPTGTHDETNYSASSAAPRGNATTVTTKCLQGCSDAVTNYTYDETGQVLTMKDPCSNSTCSDMTGSSHTITYSYVDNFDSPPSSNTNAYLTKVTSPVTNGVNHIESYKYAYSDGQLIQSTDENGQSTSYSYNDSLRRLTETDYPDGGKTAVAYNDAPYNPSNPSPSVTTTKAMTSSTNFVTLAASDGLGHVVEILLTSDPDCASGDRTNRTYDGAGNVYTVSNPYCTTSDPSYGTTTYAYDALGRTTQVTNPDSSTILTTYTGRATQVPDEGNGTQRVTRISQTDALGRLASVCEVASAPFVGSGGASSSSLIGQSGSPAACGQDIAANGFLTSYQYDVLGNLLQISQGTMTSRSFDYDSLSRLVCASNPENSSAPCPNTAPSSYILGTTGYTYDANGNLSTKTAPAPNQTGTTTVTTSYQYDALNRLTSKSYNDGATPTATFVYDSTSWGSLTNAVGRLVESTTTAHLGYMATYTQYDVMGRVAQQWQYTPMGGTNDYPLPYTYDLMGNMTAFSDGYFHGCYPAYNTASRLVSLTAGTYELPGPYNLLSGAHYNAAGQITSETLGTGETQTYTYTRRNQLQAKSSSYNSTPVYSFGLTLAPNGDVTAATDSVNGNWNYSYDQFNRLVCANVASNGTCTTPPTGTPTYTYVYDRFGNRWQQNGPTGGPYNFAANFTGNGTTNNNRMDGYSYDAAGNLLFDGTHHYFYDAENHLIQVDGTLGYCSSGTGSSATACYLYDAQGNRVHRTGYTTDTCDGTGKRDYTFDLSGHFVGEFNSNGTGCRSEIYAGGRHLATYGSSPVFDHTDWLGSSRLRNTLAYPTYNYETCTNLPFGDGLTCNSTFDTVLHFTGKERDYESGLDNFGARFDASSMGRFMSPDPGNAGAIEDDPQSWNAYTYVRNNPLNLTDPDGTNYRVCQSVNTGGGNGGASPATTCADLTNEQYDQYRKDNPNIYARPNGDLYVRNDNGTETRTGSESYYNEKDLAAAQTLATIGSTLGDPRTIGGFYGLSALGGFALYGAGIFQGGFTVLELGSEQLLTNQAAGQIIGWGTGQAGTQATEQLTQNLTKDAVQEMIKKGLNKATVEGLKNQYVRAVAKGGAKLNKQLLPRLALMEKIIQLWPK
jgi:RHS repeat-associated protein